MKEKIRLLEGELILMKIAHKLMWEDYGSELCAGNMVKDEEELENKIKKLKDEMES